MIGYESNGIVPAIDFDFAAVDGPEDCERGDQWELALVQSAISVACSGRVRKDAWHSRMAALAHLLHVPGFGTVKETARQMRLSERTIKRSLATLQRELSVTLPIEQFRPQKKRLAKPKHL